MKRNLTPSLIASAFVLSLLSSLPASAQSIVMNGGFETGDFTDWSVSSPNGNTFVSSYGPHSGSYEAVFGDWSGDATVSQSLKTTPGANYELTFWMASDGSIPNDFKVSWGGTSLWSGKNISSNGYSEYGFDVSASSASTLLVVGQVVMYRI